MNANHTQITVSNKEVKTIATDKLEFSHYIRQYEKCHKPKITRSMLADRLGVPYNIFVKRVNRSRSTTSRDYIIAICSQLGMDEDETNKALTIYGFSPLYSGNPDDDFFNLREYKLIELLNKSKIYNIDEINNILIKCGLEPLNITDRKTYEKNIVEYSYTMSNPIIKVRTDLANMHGLSLSKMYNLDLYKIDCTMAISSKIDDENLVLQLSDQGTCLVYNSNTANFGTNVFSNIEDTNEFKPYFEYLNELIVSKKNQIAIQLNDTRNYAIRVSARFVDYTVHVFAEMFNYDIPELNEYYAVEYYNNQYHFSISHNSHFMFFHLGKEKYIEIYHKYKQDIALEFMNLSEVERYYQKILRIDQLDNYIIISSKNRFNEIIELINKTIKELKNSDVKIVDEEEILGINYQFELCEYYNLVKQFCFKKREKTDSNILCDTMIPSLHEIQYNYNNKNISISLDDLFKAACLGISTVQDICSVKEKYGEIDMMMENL